MLFTGLLIFWREIRGALRRSIICGSGDGFPRPGFGGVGSSNVRADSSVYAACFSTGVLEEVPVGGVTGITGLEGVSVGGAREIAGLEGVSVGGVSGIASLDIGFSESGL